jgi:hypothetical protein
MEHVTYIRELKNALKMLVGSLKRRSHMEHLGTSRTIIAK